MTALAPIPFSNRVGALIIAGGSAVNAAGNVSPNLIDLDAGEDWSDVSAKSAVTVPIADGVESFFIRCPKGTWAKPDGSYWAVRCNANGQPVRVPGVPHARDIAIDRGCSGLVDGWGDFLADLNGQGCAITSYNGCLPPIIHAGAGTGLANWQVDVLAQAGYVTYDQINDPAYILDLFDDEIQNGCTELGWDESGGCTAPYEGLYTYAPVFDGLGILNALEANTRRDSGESWATGYSFLARYDTFTLRIGNQTYLQPSEVGHLPMVLIQGTDLVAYNQALEMAPSYRVRVKWDAMKANVGQTKMDALLEAGEGGPVDPGSTQTTGRVRPFRMWRHA